MDTEVVNAATEKPGYARLLRREGVLVNLE